MIMLRTSNHESPLSFGGWITPKNNVCGAGC